MATPAPAPASPLAGVQAKIDAVTWQQGVGALASLAAALSSGAKTVPGDALLAAEDIAGLIDPALIPVLGGIQLILPIISDALAAIAEGSAAPGNYWLGAPNAI
jgi:hypothetical protein